MPDFGNESQFVLSRLVNAFKAGEGSNLPPRLQGEFRVPFVTGLKIVDKRFYAGGTQFTLVWNNPETSASVSTYNVYALGLFSGSQQPLLLNSVKQSPCVLRVTTQNANNITFVVQTQLTNGLVSDIARSPTCAGITQSPTSGIVSIVGSTSLQGQDDSIADTTIVIPSSNALYQASIHYYTSDAGSGGTLFTTFVWEDTVDTHILNVPTIDLTVLGDYQSYVIPFYSIQSPIYFNTTMAGATGSPKYDLYISVSKLT